MFLRYVAVIWRWMTTVFVKLLAVWCIVTLFAIIWARLKRIRSASVVFPSPRHEALLSLAVMAVIFALLFPLNRLVDAAADNSLLLRFLVAAATQLLMCAPVLAILIIRHQGVETVGLSRHSLRTMVPLGVMLALVTVLLTAALSLRSRSPAPAQPAPLTAQQTLYWIATFTVSAVAHEFIYRGYLQTRLTASAGSVTGLLASSVVYSIWHLPGFLGQYNGITILVQFVALFAFGLLLGEVRSRTGSIIPAALFHAANDIAHTLW